MYKFKKMALKNPRCPLCKILLRQWGDEDNYVEKTTTVLYTCTKCGYERRRLKQWQNKT